MLKSVHSSSRSAKKTKKPSARLTKAPVQSQDAKTPGDGIPEDSASSHLASWLSWRLGGLSLRFPQPAGELVRSRPAAEVASTPRLTTAYARASLACERDREAMEQQRWSHKPDRIVLSPRK